jgi:hypothetical protein
VNAAEVRSYEEREAKRQKSDVLVAADDKDKEAPIKPMMPLEVVLDLTRATSLLVVACRYVP